MTTGRVPGDLGWAPSARQPFMLDSADHLLAEVWFVEFRRPVEVLGAACARGTANVVLGYCSPGEGDALDRFVAAGASHAPLPALYGHCAVGPVRG